MLAVVITQPGEPDVLRIEERPNPLPGPGEMLVRVRAFGVNRADLLQRRGRYPPPPGLAADVPGLEYAGEVIAAGEGAERFGVGSRVMGLVAGGAYAELVAAPEADAVEVPAALDDAAAGGTMEVFVTAFDALRRLDLSDHDWLLIHAVGSGVGTAAMQLAREWGLRVIGTSRTPVKLERARALGLVHAVDSSNVSFVEAVREITGGEGVRGVLDLIGGATLPHSLETLAPRGRLVLVGLTAGRHATLDLGVVLSRRLTVEGTVLRSRPAREKAALVSDFAAEVLPLLARGVVGPVIDRVVGLEDVADAHAHLEAGTTFGKVVVRVDGAHPHA